MDLENNEDFVLWLTSIALTACIFGSIAGASFGLIPLYLILILAIVGWILSWPLAELFIKVVKVKREAER